MVDMSPKAVTYRLRLMGELWELSVKLMDSKVIARHSSPTRKGRALEIREAIRKVVFFDWDPIGVSKYGGPTDEYDAGISPIYRILVGSRSENDLIETLRRNARTDLGVDAGSTDKLQVVARRLLGLKVTLD